MSRAHRSVRILASLALAATLTACGSSDGGGGKDEDADAAGPTTPEAGQCIAREVKDGNDTAPDFDSVVPCTEPHVYEIIGTVDIPAEYLDDSSAEASLARRTELALVGDKTSDRGRAMREAVFPTCDELFLAYTGADRITLDGKSATPETLRLTLSPATSYWYSLTPPEVWEDGTTQAVCSVRYDDGKDKDAVVEAVTSPNDKPLYAHFLATGSPARLHSCLVHNNDQVQPCNQRHMAERLWGINVDKIAGKSLLDNGLDNAESRQVDRLCGESYVSSGRSLGRGWHLAQSGSKEQRANGWVTCTTIKGTSLDKNNIGKGFKSL